MKKLILAVMLMMPLAMMAQDLKIAYINSQELITSMPEYEQALKKL